MSAVSSYVYNPHSLRKCVCIYMSVQFFKTYSIQLGPDVKLGCLSMPAPFILLYVHVDL